MKFEEFLSPDQERLIAESIEKAESQTTGEIRVHIEKRCKGDALHRTIELFAELGMHETTFQNGVLIYISIDDHKLGIYGDAGIHEKVGVSFWDEDIELMKMYFSKKEFAAGIIEVISRVGEKLNHFFPHTGDDHPNELDNTISFGK
jgi:uncharacterized membrane protein